MELNYKYIDMELTNINKSIPIKAIPSDTLDQILNTEFKYWLSNLLAMTAEKEGNVNNALQAITFHFWGLGLVEVKKAFEMYANGLLSIEPRSNYLDYILVSKIANAYKKQKLKPKPVILERSYSEQEKENIIYSGLINCFDSWYQYERIDDAYLWVHDYLMEKNLFDFTRETKLMLWEKAKNNIINKSKDQSFNEYRKIISQLHRKENNKREIEYKYLRIDAFFKQIKSQNKHIKDFL